MYISLSLCILSFTFCFDENERLKCEVSDYKIHMEAQRDKLVSTKGGKLENREKKVQKNRVMAEAMKEMQVCCFLFIAWNFHLQLFDAIKILNEIYCSIPWF